MKLVRRRGILHSGILILGEAVAVSAFTCHRHITPRSYPDFTILKMSEITGDDLSSPERKLSPQEMILQESLGIDPETEQERQDRLNKRQAQIDSENREKRQNVIVAVLAFMAAVLNYGYQFTHPITSLSLLTDMQKNSDDITVIGNNGKPTVVDFWAPWCGNCKTAAPTLASIEEEYRSKVNFVMVNGDIGENWPIIERFGVDAIPHLAMVGADGVVETALIGPIPRGVLREDLDVMLENANRLKTATEESEGSLIRPKKNLPYVMFDAFQNAPEKRKITFETKD